MGQSGALERNVRESKAAKQVGDFYSKGFGVSCYVLLKNQQSHEVKILYWFMQRNCDSDYHCKIHLTTLCALLLCDCIMSTTIE